MAINLDAIRGRLNKLQNQSTSGNASKALWKPTPGKHQIRLVPYKFNKDNPFIELFFHYNINNKSYLSPSSFGRPDPIVEFAEKLKRMGDKEDWKAAKKMEPKLRTFVPVLVRGEEGEGVRFWGFGKTVYQEILGYIADPDYGDITDAESGRDIVVEIVSAEDSGTSYPVTTIRVKPKETPLAETQEKTTKFLNDQQNITDIYQELTYAELKSVLEGWLNPSAESSDDDVEEPVSTSQLSSTKKESVETKADTAPWEEPKQPVKEESKPASSKKLDDVASAFDDLFNS
jgi:hypothetical protein